MPRYYRSAHVFCSPATGHESQGIVLLEAMACGTPVVVSNIEGFATMVTHGEEGFLTPPKDERRLAQSLMRVLEDEDLRQAMSERGLATAQQYGWKRIAQRLVSYYERLLEAKNGAAPNPRTSRKRWLRSLSLWRERARVRVRVP